MYRTAQRRNGNGCIATSGGDTRVQSGPGTYDRAALSFVTLSDAIPGAAIYFTYDGSDPTTSSVLYTGYIDITVEATMSATTTIHAIAVADGFSNGEIVSGTYNLTQTCGGTCLIDYITGQLNGDCLTQTYQGCLTGFSAQCVGNPTPYSGSACGIPADFTSCTLRSRHAIILTGTGRRS